MTPVTNAAAGWPLLPTPVGTAAEPTCAGKVLALPTGPPPAGHEADAAATPALLTLRNHAVRSTAIRQHILDVLLRSPFALSRTEIEQCLALDRVTVFRTLRTFEQKGIVHRIVDHSETVRYAAAYPDAPVPALANDHVHFKCINCRHIYCLNQVPVPAVVLPAAFRVLRGDHLLSGVCGRCQPPPADELVSPAAEP